MSKIQKVLTITITSIQALRAAVAELNNSGIKCELVPDAEPRMYYHNQLMKDLGRPSNRCDYVLELEDCHYDIGFIREGAAYTPVFDHMGSPSPHIPATKRGRGGIGTLLGTTMNGTRHPIGKLLIQYTKHATIQAAAARGFTVQSSTIDAQGRVKLQLTK